MTRVEYKDVDGLKAVLEDCYKIPKENTLSMESSWFGAVNRKEKQLIEHVERNGGKVISVVSTPISKRRYKRKVAKIIKRNDKIIAGLEK